MSLYPILRRELDKTGISVSFLATELDLTEDSIRNKLDGKAPWMLSEALRISRLLNFSDIKLLFLQFDNNS